MSLFWGRREQRAVSAADWIRGLESGSSTRAGVRVSPERAMRLGAVWSSVNLLASIVSNLPVDVVRGSGQGRRQVSPLPPLVGAPSLVVGRRDWVYQAMISMLLRGNAYGYVTERDRALRPTSVEWLDPDVVAVEQTSSLHRPSYRVGGEPVSADDVVHLRAFARPGSALGMSPVEYHAESIGVGLAARNFGAQWFGDGAHPTAIMQHEDKTLTSEQAQTIKDRVLAAMRGRREPLVVGKGWRYEQIQVAAAESQFLDAQGYTDAQIARLYGPGIAEVLGYQTSGSSLTYSNRVDRSLDLLTYAVMPWVNKFEDLLTENLPAADTARFNTAALLRADNRTRHEMYQIDREIGLYNIDELRALEDLPPLPDGQGQDYTPLRKRTPTGGEDDDS